MKRTYKYKVNNKDVGIRLEGEAVWVLTELFITDFGINYKPGTAPHYDIYPQCKRMLL